MEQKAIDKTLQEAPSHAEKKGNTRAAIWPTFRAAYTSFLYTKAPPESLDMAEITRELQARNDEVWDGNLLHLEAMLNAQAHSLDAMFHALAERAALNMGKHLSTAETYLKLALRAQGQCRATVEALADIKNPTLFASQVNLANGPPQQVNNGTAAANATPTRTRAAKNTGPKKAQLAQSKLISPEVVEDGKALDGRGTGAAVGAMPPILPMVELDRPTGPKTAEGKAKAAKNAYKGGIRPMLRAISRELRKQDELRRGLAERLD
jgi:hypothetical protein